MTITSIPPRNERRTVDSKWTPQFNIQTLVSHTNRGARRTAVDKQQRAQRRQRHRTRLAHKALSDPQASQEAVRLAHQQLSGFKLRITKLERRAGRAIEREVIREQRAANRRANKPPGTY